jgi:vanillate O-demethylase monooxygenase subunit
MWLSRLHLFTRWRLHKGAFDEVSSPPALRIRAFPVVESYSFVWVCLGDPAQLDTVPPPTLLDWVDEPNFVVVSGHLDVAANYMLLKENVLDLTHSGCVHARSFKITDWVAPPRTVRGEETCGFHQSLVQSPLPPISAEPMGLAPGTPYNRDNYGSFVSPALQIAAVDLKDPADGNITGRFLVTQATTPINPTSMHYWWCWPATTEHRARRCSPSSTLPKSGLPKPSASSKRLRTCSTAIRAIRPRWNAA